MGLFSSDTKVTVSSMAMNLLGASPDNTKEAVLHAVLSGKSIPDGVCESALAGISGKVDKLYKYAKEEYSLRLPSGVMSAVVQAPVSTVEAILENILNQQVAIIYTFIAQLSLEMAAMDYLRTHRGYKFSSNTVTVHSFPVLANGNPLLVENVTYISGTQLQINYKQRASSYFNTYMTFSEIIPFPVGLVIGELYCVTAYALLDQYGNQLPGEKIWYYKMSNGAYPALSFTESQFGTNAYLPVVPLRRDNIDLTAESRRNTELYITSKALLDKISIDINSVSEIINSNPSVGQIDHAYVMFAVSINTKKQESLAYLCDYFDYLADVSVFTKTDYTAPVSSVDGLFKRSNFSFIRGNIPDVALHEYGLDISLKYNYITSHLISGSIGNVGTITSSIVADNLFNSYKKEDESYIIFRQQISRSVYKEITVHGLVHSNNIYKGHAVNSHLRHAKNAADADECGLLIPIHYGIARGLPLIVRNKMYYDSVRLILNSYDVQKVRWYQKGIFKVVLFVIAIAIAVYSGGAGAWLAGLVAAAKVGVMAVIMYVLPALLIGLVINISMRFLAKAIGGEFALYLGAIMVIASIVMPSTGPYSSFKAFGHALPTAQGFLSAGNALMGAGNVEIAGDIADIVKETALFEDEAGKKWDALEEATKLLDSNSGMNPMEMVNPFKAYRGIPYESPDAFYNRTIHTGNIGVLVLDVIENYTEIMLRLPEATYH